MLINCCWNGTRTFVFAVVLALAVGSVASATSPTLKFLGKTYRLASYNEKAKPMWEFTTDGQSVDKWSTLLTVIDRPDAANLTDLDRLAQGTLDTYKSGGAKILLAKTMHDAAGKPYDYLVAAFDEPDKHRYELNFAKIALGSKNAYIFIYAVRVDGPGDYHKAAAKYVGAHSGSIGKALDGAPTPNVGGYPRTTF